MTIDSYEQIGSDRAWSYEQERGLIAVWGKEAVQFLDGMITNDMKTLLDGGQMLAAFPNAQGRLLALVRVMRQGDRFLFETEDATREKLFQNLFRFTFAGDFFVEDLSEKFAYFDVFEQPDEIKEIGDRFEGSLVYEGGSAAGYFVPMDLAEAFRTRLCDESGFLAINKELYEVLRIENGIPKYGVDMDENMIVPELGIDGLISYTKGCYVGQEIIARIHFRGHIAKQLTGIVAAEASGILSGSEITTADGKNAGKTTSATFSPKLGREIALAFVRYDHLEPGTELFVGESKVSVTQLPFISKG